MLLKSKLLNPLKILNTSMKSDLHCDSHSASQLIRNVKLRSENRNQTNYLELYFGMAKLKPDV